MKKLLLIAFVSVLTINTQAQTKNNAQAFWDNLKALCGKSFEGKMLDSTMVRDFAGKKLVMHVRACEDGKIRVPFFVGDNKSRTWVFTMSTDNRITLKHDHRHEDGTEEKQTQYGGTAPNSGFASLQMFPADVETETVIPSAVTNLWWVTLTKDKFTYNLRRIGSGRDITVVFDLTKTVETPSAPWGWKD